MKSTLLQKGSLLLFLIATVWFSFYIMQPPEPKPSTAPVTEFSAERAFTHVQTIAKEPHPLGSSENDSARSYILNELKILGLNPTIQEGVAARGGRVAGYTKNILAKLEGSDPKKTIMLMAHYDSVPNAPGAADDASGVAAILETLRALKAQETPLQNDIIVLFTDGEERGLLGAKLFVEEYRNLNEIDLVLNFEARGSSGPSIMFETSSPNANLIRHFAKATPYPVANSLMYTVYKILPNDTDLSVIKSAGLNGLNFAFTDGFLNYHTMQDTPENLSKASLQHHGSHLLSNVQYFGNTDFSLGGTTEYVYFNNLSGGLLYYPSGWSFPLALIASLLFIAFLVYLFRTKQLTLGTYLGSLLLFLGMILLAALGTYYGWQGIKALHPEYRWLTQGAVYTSEWYLWGFTLLFTGLFCGIYQWKLLRKYLSTQQILAGTYTYWIAISLVSAWYLPTASYIFTWPALLALVGWIIFAPDIDTISWKITGILMLSLIAVLFMISPYIYLIQVMLTTEMLAISMVLVVLVLGLIWPLLERVTRGYHRMWSGVLMAAGIACFVIASAKSGYDAKHKKQNSMNYYQNLNTGKSYWLSGDHKTDRWTSQFLGEHPRQGAIPKSTLFEGPRWLYSEAEKLDIPAPEFEIISDRAADSLRHISLRINTNQSGIGLLMEWPKTIQQIDIHGKTVTGSNDEPLWRGRSNQLYYFQDLTKPITLNLVIHQHQDASERKLSFTFTMMGIPTQLIANYEEREASMMPVPNRISDATLWKKTVDLDSLASGN